MVGLYIHDPRTGRQKHVRSANVSDAFLARYDRIGDSVDPLQAHLQATGRAAYNMSLMTMAEWLESPLYTTVASLHDIRQLIQAPIVDRRGIVGTLHFGTSDPEHFYPPEQVHLAEAVGQLVGVAAAGLHARDDIEVVRDQALAALELADTAVAISEPGVIDPRLNESARRLLSAVDDAPARLHRLLARPLRVGDRFSRQVEVDLIADDTADGALLHGHTRQLPGHHGVVVTVLELDRRGARLAGGPLSALTEREREVAHLVVDGHTDREIAEQLRLSHHTVSQYVKRIYRKLDVASRVELTRLLMAAGDH